MAVYTKKVSTTDPRFAGRINSVIATGYRADALMPDSVVLCNGCNHNIWPNEGYLVYLGKRELDKDQPYDFYCKGCVKKYFPKAKEA